MTPPMIHRLSVFLTFITLSVMSITSHAEEVLRIKGWAGYFPPALVQEFEGYIQHKYKRPVKLVIDDTLSAPEQAFDAIRSQQFDVSSYTHNIDKDNRLNFYSKGLAIPLDFTQIPNQKNLLPYFKNTPYFKSGDAVYGLPFICGPYGLFYNSKKISAPTTWQVFWQPSNSQRYSISSDYYEINIYITALASGISATNGDYYTYDKLKNNTAFIKNLNALVKNSNTMWKSAETAELLKNLNLSTGWGTALHDLNRDGQEWEQAFPQEGTTAWFDSYVIGYSLKDNAMRLGPNNAVRDRPFLRQVAHEWINYSLSPVYQAAMIKAWHSLSTTSNVASELTPEQIKELKISDTEKILSNMILWPTLSQRDRNGLKQLWENAMANRNKP